MEVYAVGRGGSGGRIGFACFVAFALMCGSVLLFVVPASAAKGDTERVSVADDGSQLDSPSSSASVSADGRFVAFTSQEGEVVENDTNGERDVFVRDRENGTTERVSVSSNGDEGDGGSSAPSISADGRFVAFESGATNLVDGDTNDGKDIFVHDRQMNETERVSVSSNGDEGDGGSSAPSISSDGNLVAFSSDATNLIVGDANGTTDVFVRDRENDMTERVNVSSGGDEAGEHVFDSGSSKPSISADGRFVAFESDAANLVENDTNGTFDIFVRDRMTEETERVSLASDGTQGGAFSSEASISADGRYVAFESRAALVVEDTEGETDVYVRDRRDDETSRVSVSSDGVAGDRFSEVPSISATGRFVAFESGARNLVENDTNGALDVFIHDFLGSAEPPPGGGDNPKPKNPNACTIVGTPGNDILRGTPGRDVICGLGGNDIIRGLGGNDVINGGPGNDRLIGGAGNDRIIGGARNDRILGGTGKDQLFGQAGNDRLAGGAGNDTLAGGIGNDRLVGGAGRDRLLGQGGNDVLNARDGVRGNDVANGGTGRDRCAADARDVRRSCP